MNGAVGVERLPLIEPEGRAPLLGTSKDMLSKALEWASVSIGVPFLGNMKGLSFPRVFERREKCLYLRKFL